MVGPCALCCNDAPFWPRGGRLGPGVSRPTSVLCHHFASHQLFPSQIFPWVQEQRMRRMESHRCVLLDFSLDRAPSTSEQLRKHFLFHDKSTSPCQWASEVLPMKRKTCLVALLRLEQLRSWTPSDPDHQNQVQEDEKHNNSSRATRSQATTSEDLLKCNSHSCRNKRKKSAYLQKTSGRQRSLLPTLQQVLGGSGSWLHPFWSPRFIAHTWGPYLPPRCSITVSGRDLAFPLHKVSLGVGWQLLMLCKESIMES